MLERRGARPLGMFRNGARAVQVDTITGARAHVWMAASSIQWRQSISFISACQANASNRAAPGSGRYDHIGAREFEPVESASLTENGAPGVARELPIARAIEDHAITWITDHDEGFAEHARCSSPRVREATDGGVAQHQGVVGFRSGRSLRCSTVRRAPRARQTWSDAAEIEREAGAYKASSSFGELPVALMSGWLDAGCRG